MPKTPPPIEEIKELLEAGHFKTLKEVFKLTAPTPVARRVGLETSRFVKRLQKVEDFRLKDLYFMASYFKVSEDIILNMAHNEHKRHKKA